jgi:hypothetical protein
MKIDKPKKLMLTWNVTATAGFETAWVSFHQGLGFLAEGRIFGRLPNPYWAQYLLEVDPLGITRRLTVESYDGGHQRRMELRHTKQGWLIQGKHSPRFKEAMDCDIAYSPLTNAMPIARHQIQLHPISRDFLMVFVEMPSLRIIPSRQKYTHLKPGRNGGLVRFASGSFKADLSVDSRAFVIRYPGMADRLPLRDTQPS